MCECFPKQDYNSISLMLLFFFMIQVTYFWYDSRTFAIKKAKLKDVEVWSKHKLDNVLRDIYVQNIEFIKQEGIKRLFASNIKKTKQKSSRLHSKAYWWLDSICTSCVTYGKLSYKFTFIFIFKIKFNNLIKFYYIKVSNCGEYFRFYNKYS